MPREIRKPRRPPGARPAFRVCVLLALLAIAVPLVDAGATDLEFSAAVDQTTVALGEQFQLTLTVHGEDMLTVPAPTLPAMPDFNVLGSSSSQSTNISFINGQVRRQASIAFVYLLSAKKLGKLLIPACTLNYKGKEYQSQPIEMAVVQAPQGQAAPVPAQPGMPPARAQVPLEGNLFLSVVPSRRTVYVGEPVTVEISLCTRFQIGSGGWVEVPSFDGFWMEKIFDADKFDFQQRTIEGRPFGVSMLKKVALFPLSPGDVTLKPLTFNVAVTQRPRDIFDMFVRVQSKPVTIHVLGLPEKGKPAEFTGGVGRFTMSAALDRAASAGSEPANLTVKIAGSGNVRLIEKPAIAPVAGLKILDPEIKDDVHVAGDEVQGTKTLRYPILPQTDGKYVIPPIRMAYFDPRSRSYRTLEGGPFELSACGTASSAPLAEASGLKVLGTDINYIKPDARALATAPLDPPGWPNLLYLLSLGMVGGAFWYRGHSLRLQSDRGYARKLRSSGLVRRRLGQAEGHLKRHDEKGFYGALAQAVAGYIGDRLNIDTHAMTKERLRAELDRLGVAADTSGSVLEVIEQCEIARFSPDSVAGSDPRRLLQRARDALGRI